MKRKIQDTETLTQKLFNPKDNDDNEEERIVKIVLEVVEEIGIGEFVVGGDDALGEDLERVNVVHFHRHR
ncbi:hypothetical protein CR513_33865, partial [Mucuna pruriens]